MSSTIIHFDTLQHAKKLQKAGFTAEQAEIQAEAFNEQANAINSIIDNNLATKNDLLNLETSLEERLTGRINEMCYKLTIRLGSMLAAAVLILGALIPIISKTH